MSSLRPGKRRRKRPPSTSDLKLLRLFVVIVLLAVPALPLLAKSFSIANADVTIEVSEDGTLDIKELLTYDFSGQFSGGYRDIRLRPGESVQVVSVSDEAGGYALGGCTVLGCSSAPGSYGVEVHSDFVRVVWHHDSSNEQRTFEIVYRMTGATLVYDDVIDVQFRVWGEQWEVGLDRLSARVIIPSGAVAGDVLVWGHPYGVDGATSLGDDGVSPSLDAQQIPAGQLVELRTVFPRALLTRTGGAQVFAESGLESILAEEAQAAETASDAAAAARTGFFAGGASAIAIVLGLGGLVYFRYGKEPAVDYDREYEQEPPSELSPAEVAALLTQGRVDEKAFTATLFDLIRVGRIDAQPSQVQRTTWGGLKTEDITDLVLSTTDDESPLRNYQQSVMTVVRRVLELGPRPLHEFRQAIREDATANAKTYQTFRDRVLSAVRSGGLIDDAGHTISWIVRIGLVLTIAVSYFVLRSLLSGQPGGAIIVVLVLFGMALGATILFVLLSFRRVRTKRTPAGALEAARWNAFRRYLTDFSRIKDAPVISLDLWDRYLVYAITFGVAEEVLEQARLHAPPELETNSSIFWFGHYGYTGGHTENAFAGLESALSGAFSPPSSGGGGGFSGGGGGGSGGGGGGAW